VSAALHDLARPKPTPKDDFTAPDFWQRNLLSVSQLRCLPRRGYLIDGLLPLVGLVILHGDPRSFKTFIALTMALCIAAGVPFFGRAAAQRRVVYVALEGHSGLWPRIAAWLSRHPGAAKAIEENFRLITVPLCLFTAGRPNTEGRRVLDGLIGGLRAFAPGLFVVDTLARTMGEGDENKNVDMGLVVQALQEVEREFSAATMVIHHPAKNQTGKPTPRGASNLPGAADAIFFAKRTAAGTVLQNTKLKDAEEAEDLHFVAEQVRVDAEDGRPETSLVLALAAHSALATPLLVAKPQDLERDILKALEGAPEPILASALADAVTGRSKPSGAFNNALKGLVEAGRVMKSGTPAAYTMARSSLLPELPRAA
jgi:hypothetical protein